MFSVQKLFILMSPETIFVCLKKYFQKNPSQDLFCHVEKYCVMPFYERIMGLQVKKIIF